VALVQWTSGMIKTFFALLDISRVTRITLVAHIEKSSSATSIPQKNSFKIFLHRALRLVILPI